MDFGAVGGNRSSFAGGVAQTCCLLHLTVDLALTEYVRALSNTGKLVKFEVAQTFAVLEFNLMSDWFVRTIGVLTMLGLSACASITPQATIRPDAFLPPDPIPVQQELHSYRINAGDRVKVVVFNAEAVSGEFIVEPAGSIGLPLIGVVEAAGLTTAQLAERLEQRYGERYIRNPDISVQLVEFTKSAVTVTGAVRAPGVIETVGPTNLIRAIAAVQGPSETANSHRVIVFRKIGGVRHAAGFDLSRIQAGLDANPAIYGGDEIVVDGSRLKQALRDLLSITPILGLYQILR